MPSLTILNGDEIGKSYEWADDAIRIGRNSANDFVITNSSVSGEHCIIEPCENGWRIKDLDSTNGSRVNDQPITMATLHRNDVVALGDIKLSFRGEDVPESDPGTIESVDSIPRTTIVMRPTVAHAGPIEGFSKKSEAKRMLTNIIIIGIVVAIALVIVLLLKLLGIL